MEQDRAGGSENMKQDQDNRRVLKPPTARGEVPQQPQQPQKCPRCESMNTKFCYYNNYSLSQPRYFCKTCRRYWTQGGTLRNVPVGGGCRKGKRPKTSNSASSASSADQVIEPNFQTPQTSFSLTSSGPGSGATASISHGGMGSYVNSDHARGFLNSLATIHSINNQPPAVSFTLNQPLNLGGDLGSNSANLGSLHGFNAISSFGSSSSRQLSSYFPFEENLVRPSNRPASTNAPSQQQDWHQNFPSRANNSYIVSDTTMWSISTTTTTAGNTINNAGVGSSSSLNPDHQWPDQPGYGNPP